MANNELPRIRKESGVFSIEVGKIKPNPMQPRREFDETALNDLAESIRQYGVLQPLVVIRQEKSVPTGSMVEYELIAGERRLKASKIAGLDQVPVIIREEPSEKVKLELALIENIQREDLNPLERADAFKQLVDNFKMRHHEVGSKIGKSREFVSNSIRLLALPEEIQEGLSQGLIAEGHTRPLLSLSKQPDEQISLYREIIYRKMTVREAEGISRKMVKEKIVRRVQQVKEDPEARVLEETISDALGTKVSVERRGPAKRISIDFFSEEELQSFLAKLNMAAQQEGGIEKNMIMPQPIEEQPEKEESFEETFVIETEEVLPDASTVSDEESTEEELRENFTI
jgi:ParB family chromosome partitioning protein